MDTNVLIFAMVPSSPVHGPATCHLASLQVTGIELWVSRQVLGKYLAALSRPQTFTPALAAIDLVADVSRFEGQFRVAEDDRTVTGLLLTLLVNFPTGGRQVYDANIVATMRAHGIAKLLTHNLADFARFAGLISIISL